MLRAIIAAAVFGAVTPADSQEADPYTARLAVLEELVADHPMADRDYWLAMVNAMGNVEKVSLVFGMADDLAFCNLLADSVRSQHPNTRLFCLPAN